jgi:hypothetical protein
MEADPATADAVCGAVIIPCDYLTVDCGVGCVKDQSPSVGILDLRCRSDRSILIEKGSDRSILIEKGPPRARGSASGGEDESKMSSSH